ncbi:MAG TPA: pyruvate, phosphate dikinase [Dermatophilaceae bacterium]|jgi:pyruvate,orthophosphate dikinase|nr:pyruvate, phosphate dikinase [Dermatophilaceae bacterium]HMT88758.1 pyruvate, phosphate dikinase [Dermatophilaceae bacterium]
MTTRYVYDFSEGDKDQKDLLGGKGANLAEMVKIGLPVPPGFTITTDACRVYLQSGKAPESLAAEVTEHLGHMEKSMGRTLGDPANPLLVSVRSGAKFSMPGMMETVLNIGLNDESVYGLADVAGERFAWDSYRRLLQMFGKTVLGIDSEVFEARIEQIKHSRHVEQDTDLNAADLAMLCVYFKTAIENATGNPFPQDPREQLNAAVEAVFRSWGGDRAVLYRRQERIPHDLGTAVNVQTMVFGNMSDDSGTGVCFTRDPSTGEKGVYGDFLMNAQGEDVVAGIRNARPLAELHGESPDAYALLLDNMKRLEDHYRDLCDIEFTIERGKLWMLQTRVGKRTAEAAFRIAGQLIDEGVISEEEALTRVTGAQLSNLMFPRFDASAKSALITTGVAASPGAAVGKIVFSSAAAKEWADRGEDVILVRTETNPDDLVGMIASKGILTSRGGKTSHAAVVARGMGTTCVCGADELVIDSAHKSISLRGQAAEPLREGDMISIDGATGQVFRGAVPVVASAVVDYFEGNVDAASAEASDTVKAVDRIMKIADRVRRLRVRANADTPEDAARSVRFGAEGIGLCRTEHMFLGDRRELVERLILAETDEARTAALEGLRPLQRKDFEEIFQAMGNLPVTIRLIDPPLHEFLPNIVEMTAKMAVAEADGTATQADKTMYAAVQRLHESNPMFGLRGVRLGLVTEGLFEMQVRAILEAFQVVRKSGIVGTAEIMVPLIDTYQELDLVRNSALKIAREKGEQVGPGHNVMIGTMMELPRACLTAGKIAESADFFSFGTNDLTQTTWGFSRDDVEASFFSNYLEKGIFQVSPFETIDEDGVGQLVKLAVSTARAVKPNLKAGVCGEHGGDPESVHFFHNAGLDYVSCSPFRVPVARLEAGRAAVMNPA